MTAEQARRAAEQARKNADEAEAHSEYPRYGKAVHLGHSVELDRLAELLDEIGTEPPPENPDNRRASRQARRVYWLRRKAAEKAVESAALAARSHDMGSRRPLGQPIVGSPARQRTQRNAISKMQRVDDKAHAAYSEAKELKRRAVAAENNRNIYNDDPDALDKLRAKLASLEAHHAAMKQARKKGTSGNPLLNYDAPDGVEFPNRYDNGSSVYVPVHMTKAEYKRFPADNKGTRQPSGCRHRVRWFSRMGEGYTMSMGPVFLTDSKVHPRPMPGTEENPTQPSQRVPASWALSNSNAQIRNVRERINQLEARAQRLAEEPRPTRVAVGGIEIRDNLEFDKVEIHFPGKPSPEIRARLKSYGFRWIRSAGCWARRICADTDVRVEWLTEAIQQEGGQD